MPFQPMWLRAFIAVIITTAPLLPAQGQSPDAAAYVTPHSVAAVTMRVADTVRMPFAQNYPVEVLAAASEDFLGLPIDTIDRVTAVIDPPMGITPQYVVVLNSSVPIELENFRTELTKHTEVSELLGRPLLESKEKLLPSLCLADTRTLLIGPKLYLKRLLRGVDSAGSDLAEAMRADGAATNHLHAAITMDPLKPLIEMGLEQAIQRADPEAEPFIEGVLLLDRAVAAIDLSGSRPSAVTVYANDAEAADQIEKLMADGLFLFRREMTSNPQFQELRNHPEAVARAWVAYIERMFDAKATELSTLREGEDAFVVARFDAGSPLNQVGAIYVIGILVALLLPAVQAAREAARRNQSMNNVKQVLLALLNYESTYGHFPPQAICAADGTPLLSWRVAILPFVEEQALYERFKLDEPWDSPHNRTLLAEMPDVYHDPSSVAQPEDGKTDYLGVVGPTAIFDGSANGVKLARVTDGLSNTVAIVQVNQAADSVGIEWTKPADFDAVANAANPAGAIRSLHPGVFLAGFADGSVTAIPLDADPETLNKLMTINGNDFVQRP